MGCLNLWASFESFRLTQFQANSNNNNNKNHVIVAKKIQNIRKSRFAKRNCCEMPFQFHTYHSADFGHLLSTMLNKYWQPTEAFRRAIGGRCDINTQQHMICLPNQQCTHFEWTFIASDLLNLQSEKLWELLENVGLNA